MRKYTITLNEHQFMLIIKCLEDISRFLSGQTELYFTSELTDNSRELRQKLKELKPLVTPGLEPNESYDWAGNSCCNLNQQKAIAETYYLYREMLHQYVTARKMQNVYSSPTLRCKDSGEPIKITWEE